MLTESAAGTTPMSLPHRRLGVSGSRLRTSFLHSRSHSRNPPHLRPEDPDVPGLRRGLWGSGKVGTPTLRRRLRWGLWDAGVEPGSCLPGCGALLTVACSWVVLKFWGEEAWQAGASLGGPVSQAGIGTSTGSAPSEHLAVSVKVY